MIYIIVMICAIDILEEIENRCFFFELNGSRISMLDRIASTILMIILIADNTFLLTCGFIDSVQGR